MTRKELLALSIFVSYFLLIVGLFALIIHSLWRRWKVSNLDNNNAKLVHVFSLLATASLVHTWYYMIAFLFWSFRNYEASLGLNTSGIDGLDRLLAWLMNSDLFEQAWSIVCGGPMHWWWSEKLCLFTVGYWTIFLATEGRSRHVGYVWAYMLLGQLVAISVASNLFYVALLLSTAHQAEPSDDAPARRFPSPVLWLSVLVSLITVARSPYTTEKTFLANLLIMHATIVVPLIYPMQNVPYETRTIYAIVCGISVALHAQTTVSTYAALPERSRTVFGFARAAWTTVHSHPAQSSITWDVIWTTISSAVWSLLPSERLEDASVAEEAKTACVQKSSD